MQTQEPDRTRLRKELIAQRSRMEATLLQRLGNQIAGRVIESEWYMESTVIHCFSGSIAKREVATSALLHHVLMAGKKLVMPRVTGKNGSMEHYLVTDLDSLVIGKWGIPEPEGGESVSPDELDLVLVPGLAADLSGNRIGFGMGYYDRFLPLTKARTMMLLPQSMIMEQIPTLPHDIPVQALATEREIIYCRNHDKQD